MKIAQKLALFVILLGPLFVFGQATGKLSGTVISKTSQKQLGGLTVQVIQSGAKTITDSLGNFRFTQLKPGAYTLEITGVGFKTKQLNNLPVTSGNENNIQIEIEELINQLSNVTVTSKKNTARAATLESPLSIQRLTTEDIKNNPGGFFDISKVIQSLPGVGGGAAGGTFRNDIIIRGGAPSENVFYLDGIEIPIINHFGTQGSGGGPAGILNVLLIEDVKLSTSAFDAKYDNALSSVFQFKQKNGNPNKFQGNLRLSLTESALTLDGPLSKKTTFIASTRKSSLGVLANLLNWSFLPNYADFQFKTTTRINDKTTLTFLGVAAVDRFKFITPDSLTAENQYVLSSNPTIDQNSYTIGATLKKIIPNGFWNLSVSRNFLDNQANKFEDNKNPVESQRTLKIKSIEAESKIRFDVTKNYDNITLSYGLTGQLVRFDNDFFQVLNKSSNPLIYPSLIVQSKTNTNFIKYGGFAQIGTRVFNDKLSLSAGLRMDANNLSNSESNPLKQLSPRLSASLAISDVLRLNASYGIYYRLPTYTQLNFTDNSTGKKTNPGKYIQATHYVAGFEYLPKSTTRFTIEGFYKSYSNYPVSVLDGISIANKGLEFGAIGNEPITQSGKGRAYGIEFFAQQKLTKNFFGVFSYTFYRSEFSGLNNKFVSASWDNRQLISMTAGYKLPKNWEIGLKFRYQGAAPFTPYNEPLSRANYLAIGSGVFDFSRINSMRLSAFNAADIRFDKKWNFKKTTLDFYIDITNFYGSEAKEADLYTFKRNQANTAFVTTDGLPIKADGSNAIPVYLKNSQSTILPSIGLIVEF
jgi:outer membrane receptor for ferrienterochelin and colicin